MRYVEIFTPIILKCVPIGSETGLGTAPQTDLIKSVPINSTAYVAIIA
jgi:hypothetical protein